MYVYIYIYIYMYIFFFPFFFPHILLSNPNITSLGNVHNTWLVIKWFSVFLNVRFDVSMHSHPCAHIPCSSASIQILVYVTNLILLLMYCWSIVDPPLIHSWSIVDPSLIHHWSIVDMTCTHIFGWDSIWKASIHDSNKVTPTNCECHILCVYAFSPSFSHSI